MQGAHMGEWKRQSPNRFSMSTDYASVRFIVMKNCCCHPYIIAYGSLQSCTTYLPWRLTLMQWRAMYLGHEEKINEKVVGFCPSSCSS